MSQRLFEYTYFVTLKLIPNAATKLSIHHLQGELPVLGKISSWSNKWKIINFYVKDNRFFSNSTLVEKIIVRMVLRSKYINPVEIVDEMKSNLLQTRFVLEIDNSSYDFNHNIAEFRKLDFYTDIGKIRSRHSVVSLRALNNETILEKIYRDNIYLAIPFKNTVIVTSKMKRVDISTIDLCDLVQLYKYEYEMYTDYIVYYKLLDKVLFDGQFTTTTDENGETVVRICLSESGFKFTSNGSTTTQAYRAWIWYPLFWYQLLMALGIYI